MTETRIEFEGKAFFLNTDNLPDDVVGLVKSKMISTEVSEAKNAVLQIESQIYSITLPSSDQLMAWALENHPTYAMHKLLKDQLAVHLSIIKEYEK